jgi:hypothetical protein
MLDQVPAFARSHPYVWLWETKVMSAAGWYAKQCVDLAQKQNAPANAIYRTGPTSEETRVWSTLEGVP